jgi:hypothetical protein
MLNSIKSENDILMLKTHFFHLKKRKGKKSFPNTLLNSNGVVGLSQAPAHEQSFVQVSADLLLRS